MCVAASFVAVFAGLYRVAYALPLSQAAGVWQTGTFAATAFVVDGVAGLFGKSAQTKPRAFQVSTRVA